MIASALALFLTGAQIQAFNIAYSEGEKIGYPLTVSALIWQESSFCARTHHKDSGTGCGAIHLDTAKVVEGKYVSRAQLQDTRYNIHFTAKYFAYCLHRMGSWRKAVGCFHYGYPVASKKTDIENDPYVLSVAAKVKQLMSMRQDNE